MCVECNYDFIYDFDHERAACGPLPETAGSAVEASPAETISASIPAELADLVRAHAGRRQFSQFAARALKRELVRDARIEFVDDFKKRGGVLDEEHIERIRRAMRT